MSMLLDASGRPTASSQKEILNAAMEELFRAMEKSGWGCSVILMAPSRKRKNANEFAYGVNPIAMNKAVSMHDAMIMQLATLSQLVFPDVSQAMMRAKQSGPVQIQLLQKAFKEKMELAIQEAAREWLLTVPQEDELDNRSDVQKKAAAMLSHAQNKEGVH